MTSKCWWPNCIAANHLNSTKVSWYFQKILSLAQVVKYTLHIYTHIIPKNDIVNCDNFSTRTFNNKTITKYHRKKKRSLRIFYSQEIFNFIWLSFSILLKHFIFFLQFEFVWKGLTFSKSSKIKLMIFVIQNFASFFFKVNETDWSRDFKFFLFARFSHNQPLLFLLIPQSHTITFKTMFHCPQHLVKFLRNSISTHTHKIVVDFKMSRKMLKCQKVGSRKNTLK